MWSITLTSLDSTSFKKLSTIDFSSLNVTIITIYEHVKQEKMWAFVGSVPSVKPRDEDYALLGLFLVTNINPLEEDVNVQDFFNYVMKQSIILMQANHPDIMTASLLILGLVHIMITKSWTIIHLLEHFLQNQTRIQRIFLEKTNCQ